MFFIAGAGEKIETVSRGEFLCPECGDIRSYNHNRISTNFTLFFIPIWSSSKRPDFVQCQSCGSQYNCAIIDNEAMRLSRITKLTDVASETGNTAVTSRDPGEAQEKYRSALEAFNQALELKPHSNLRESILSARQTLIDIFPSQMCMGHALGICDRAETVKHVDNQLPLLREAKDILEEGLKRKDVGYDRIMSIYVQVVDRIGKGETLSLKLADKGTSPEFK